VREVNGVTTRIVLRSDVTRDDIDEMIARAFLEQAGVKP